MTLALAACVGIYVGVGLGTLGQPALAATAFFLAATVAVCGLLFRGE